MFTDAELEMLLETLDHFQNTAFLDYTSIELRQFLSLSDKIDELLNGKD